MEINVFITIKYIKGSCLCVQTGFKYKYKWLYMSIELTCLLKKFFLYNIQNKQKLFLKNILCDRNTLLLAF